jgi:hypothetical protein
MLKRIALGSALSACLILPAIAQSVAVVPFSYKNITTDTTTVLKTGAGVLHTITFNAPTATEVVTIYDNGAASGTKIGTITVPASPLPVTLTYDIQFSTGLTVVTATATSDITVAYR